VADAQRRRHIDLGVQGPARRSTVGDVEEPPALLGVEMSIDVDPAPDPIALLDVVAQSAQ
jgi:hypothetical protein